jgi:hypothetical protein
MHSTRASVHDQLADQAVVVGRNLVALIDPGIDPHAEPAGRVVMADRAGRGHEGVRVFGIDAAFDGVALETISFWRTERPAPEATRELLVDQIDAGDRLGDRMLDLQAGVHLDEVELAVLIEEFDRARAAIAQLAHRVGADFADLLALLVVQRRESWPLPTPSGGGAAANSRARRDGWRCFGPVADHLHLDMARAAEIFFDIDSVVAEGRTGFRARALHSATRVRLRTLATFMPRPPPPAVALMITGKPISAWRSSSHPRSRGHARPPIRARPECRAASAVFLAVDLVAHDEM